MGFLFLKHPKLKKKGLDLNFKKYEITALKQGIQLFEKLRKAITVIAITIQNKQENKLNSGEYNSDRHLELIGLDIIKLDKKLHDLLK